MTSHVEQQVAARIAAAKAKQAERQQQRAEFGRRRRIGLRARHAAKLRRLSAAGKGVQP
ncbi:hypothetical protein ACGFMM_11155 [Streptomyces sp. NPDC048604]|uniref:hypothetical protein n=1 Tax=Streptomyces sp. NPDC048604 TaxID=3365578 RepID=UPI00371EB800